MRGQRANFERNGQGVAYSKDPLRWQGASPGSQSGESAMRDSFPRPSIMKIMHFSLAAGGRSLERHTQPVHSGSGRRCQAVGICVF